MLNVRLCVCHVSVLLLALGLLGCGFTKGLFGGGTTFGGNRYVEFRISEELNDNYPVAVELILVYDQSLAEELLDLQASEWFAKRQQYKRDFSSKMFESWKWEWTPGQITHKQLFRYNVGALMGLVFASYASPGNHRARVEPDYSLRVILHEDRFEVEDIR